MPKNFLEMPRFERRIKFFNLDFQFAPEVGPTISLPNIIREGCQEDAYDMVNKNNTLYFFSRVIFVNHVVGMSWQPSLIIFGNEIVGPTSRANWKSKLSNKFIVRILVNKIL